MSATTCAECGTRPSKYYIIHPDSGRPVMVCSVCEKQLAERIAAKQSETVGGEDSQSQLRLVASAEGRHSQVVA